MIHRVADIFAKVLDRAEYAVILGRLGILDWLPGPPPDRVIRKQGERLRKDFPEIDFDARD